MTASSDLAWLTVADAAELLRSKKLSPVEYTKALIARAERHDKNYNAYLRATPDIALEDARRAESEILRGEWRGPFHGVPYGLKDIVDYTGLPTTAHSKILQDNVAKADAVVTQKLRAAGGVFMGKLSTHEFATGGPSFDLPWPRRATLGTATTSAAVHPAAPARPLPRVFCRLPSAPTPAARCAIPPRCAA
jgi:aspartyl-tRNA(Asn)/glutamyl-tRNA(Gln) amidotransferase subunit A